jgi:hypothetical protein
MNDNQYKSIRHKIVDKKTKTLKRIGLVYDDETEIPLNKKMISEMIDDTKEKIKFVENNLIWLKTVGVEVGSIIENVNELKNKINNDIKL